MVKNNLKRNFYTRTNTTPAFRSKSSLHLVTLWAFHCNRG